MVKCNKNMKLNRIKAVLEEKGKEYSSFLNR